MSIEDGKLPNGFGTTFKNHYFLDPIICTNQEDPCVLEGSSDLEDVFSHVEKGRLISQCPT